MEKEIQGIKVPALGFGTFQLSVEQAEEGVKDALSIGYRHIDTAAMYNNEEGVGRGIKNSETNRQDIFLTSKVWFDNLKPDQVKQSLKDSLKKLQTDYLDLYLIHWPNPDIPLNETLEAMFELKQEGKTRQVGVSNFPPSWVKEALKSGPVFCNQVEYHPYLEQSTLVKLAREHDFLLTAYCPLGKGAVFGENVLEEIGAKYNKTAGQVTLRWFLEQDHVAAVPKSASHKHRKQNFEVFDFELTSEEVQKISQLNEDKRLINPSWAPDWKR